MSVITCPSCQTPAPPGAVFCDHCGYDLRTLAPPSSKPVPPTFLVPAPEPETIVCPVCQHKNIPGSAFCENCGAQLKNLPRPAAAPPQPPSRQPELPPAPTPPPAAPPEPAFSFPTYPEPPAPPPPPPPPPPSITGRLLLVESNVSLPIPPNKTTIVLGREDPVSGVFPDLDLDPHGGHENGVGRRHAQLVLRDDQLFIEDLDSVNGTLLNRQPVAAHEMKPLKSGDELRLGKLALVYYSS
ncbi:MAG: double zinc ribbon domain-containing protein [Chloroflexota bacterium]